MVKGCKGTIFRRKRILAGDGHMISSHQAGVLAAGRSWAWLVPREEASRIAACVFGAAVAIVGRVEAPRSPDAGSDWVVADQKEVN